MKNRGGKLYTNVYFTYFLADYINMRITNTSSDSNSKQQTDPYSSLDNVGMSENVYDVIKN